MQNFIVLAIVGLFAQLIDGSLGMAYGVSSMTLLLALGLTPAIASASVHLAQVGTTLASGVSHWRFGNVDWRTVYWMAVPGGIGAFLGALALTSVSAEAAAPWVAVFLFGLGVYILARFSIGNVRRKIVTKKISGKFLSSLGFGAGFMDAAGGGGWGPISTPTLLSSGRMEPRKVVGTVDTSEFVVAVCASVGFLIALGMHQVPMQVVGALLLGGVIAAPVAAWLVRLLHPRILGTAVGGVILLINARTFLEAIGIDSALYIPVYAVLIASWVAALTSAILKIRREKTAAQEFGFVD